MFFDSQGSTLSVSHEMVILMIFFRHENQACPPSLSNLGKLRQGIKADLLLCLENCIQTTPSQPDAEVVILEMEL